jgi:multicomponent Na+:H+ antiporter subunit A
MATGVVALPAFVGALLLAVPRAAGRARALGVAGSAGSLLLAAALLAEGADGVVVAWEWAPALSVNVAWRLNVATLAFAALVSGVGALVLHFAGAYFGASDKGRRAIAVLCLFEASMLGLVLADELLLLFAFWELTGLCSFFLINTDADKRDDTFASAQQALVVTVGGALPMLAGFLYLILETGTGSLSALAAMELSPRVQTLAFALILPGILTKSAQVPFHFWLPGAMAAPTPISAYLHSATMVKAGLILLLYLFPVCGDSAVWTGVLIPVGALTCIWGSYRALGEDDAKLLMAWSTVSQLGLMTITIGLGTDLAIRAAALYLLAHGVFKAGLFLGIGAIDHAARTRRLSELGGLRHRTPLLCVVVAVLAGSMAGLPPFAGFLSKELVLKKLLLPRHRAGIDRHGRLHGALLSRLLRRKCSQPARRQSSPDRPRVDPGAGTARGVEPRRGTRRGIHRPVDPRTGERGAARVSTRRPGASTLARRQRAAGAERSDPVAGVSVSTSHWCSRCRSPGRCRWRAGSPLRSARVGMSAERSSWGCSPSRSRCSSRSRAR